MPRCRTFAAAVQVLSGTVPDPAFVVSVEVSEDASLVTLRTLTPARVIGPQGETASRIRHAPSASVGCPVELQVIEVEDEDG